MNYVAVGFTSNHTLDSLTRRKVYVITQCRECDYLDTSRINKNGEKNCMFHKLYVHAGTCACWAYTKGTHSFEQQKCEKKS